MLSDRLWSDACPAGERQRQLSRPAHAGSWGGHCSAALPRLPEEGQARPEEPLFRAVPPSLAVLEVHQFAQEAVVADAWLTAQEPLLRSRELGNSVDEVEQLIRRHEAFRKAAATWEERFSSLRRLTTVGAQTQALRPGRLGWVGSVWWVHKTLTGLSLVSVAP